MRVLPAIVPRLAPELYDPTLGLIGDSQVMESLRTVIRKVAASNRPVLVTGPTGSGKELAVSAIHKLGAHADEPLIDVNCSALPDNLMESQLFGHERGAFTGADRTHQGTLQAVGQGTLFLDEIAELPLDLQAKLLRVLETRRYQPVGSTRTLWFQGRIVCATHVDLAGQVEAGAFREDLYYRLNVLEIQVPSLDDRRSDIPALVEHFSATQGARLAFSEEAIATLMQAAWPGNVRQLRNAIDRLAVFAPPGMITRETIHSILSLRPKEGPGAALRRLAREILRIEAGDKLKLLEGTLVEEALLLAEGNKSAAARLLGVHRKVIERRVA
jgi:DNA-binding NtrC family response regulator